jgi:hypothetical protein
MIGDPLPLVGSHRVACDGTRKARLLFHARIGCETRGKDQRRPITAHFQGR